MDPQTAKQRVMQYVRTHSGLEQPLPYLRMSKIGYCPRWLYDHFGRSNDTGLPSNQAHLNCISGTMYESKMLELLAGGGICDPKWVTLPKDDSSREMVAAFDTRFRGHFDARTCDGDLVEIKSMDADQYRRFTRTSQFDRHYLWQVQAYLRYGNFERALFVSVCREPFAYWFQFVRRDELIGTRIEEKAMTVLAAIDARDPSQLTCECAHCGSERRTITPFPERAVSATVRRGCARPVSSRRS